MGFRGWLVNYTGLSLHDFRVLDLEGESAQVVRGLFAKWLEDSKPTPSMIMDALAAAKGEGFDMATA